MHGEAERCAYVPDNPCPRTSTDRPLAPVVGRGSGNLLPRLALPSLATRRTRRRPFTCTVKTRRWFLPRLWAVWRRSPPARGERSEAVARQESARAAAAGGMTSSSLTGAASFPVPSGSLAICTASSESSPGSVSSKLDWAAPARSRAWPLIWFRSTLWDQPPATAARAYQSMASGSSSLSSSTLMWPQGNWPTACGPIGLSGQVAVLPMRPPPRPVHRGRCHVALVLHFHT